MNCFKPSFFRSFSKIKALRVFQRLLVDMSSSTAFCSSDQLKQINSSINLYSIGLDEFDIIELGVSFEEHLGCKFSDDFLMNATCLDDFYKEASKDEDFIEIVNELCK
eukprot:TRINITY_DN780779_c0_g1_i1.p1 TRINITY_DN780779_c0_g1~~TRINITY_DN780779_c0_g1_i1.p1  ORF type:complete len:108 (-),score=15.22 TRINITY_DN780779_c0_g1_i1:41-364(-)